MRTSTALRLQNSRTAHWLQNHLPGFFFWTTGGQDAGGQLGPLMWSWSTERLLLIVQIFKKNADAFDAEEALRSITVILADMKTTDPIERGRIQIAHRIITTYFLNRK